MAGPGTSQRPPEKKRSGGLAWLLAGILLGVLGAVFLPALARPYLPDALRGKEAEVNGIVEEKATSDERLLLTVGSDAGAMLVTFTKDIAEIDLLVGVGDSVLLVVDEYAPFIDDARIRRVMKRSGWKAAPGGAVRPDSSSGVVDSGAPAGAVPPASMDSAGRAPAAADSSLADSAAAGRRQAGNRDTDTATVPPARPGAAAP